jgi:hypothetical protein
MSFMPTTAQAVRSSGMASSIPVSSAKRASPRRITGAHHAKASCSVPSTSKTIRSGRASVTRPPARTRCLHTGVVRGGAHAAREPLVARALLRRSDHAEPGQAIAIATCGPTREPQFVDEALERERAAVAFDAVVDEQAHDALGTGRPLRRRVRRRRRTRVEQREERGAAGEGDAHGRRSKQGAEGEPNDTSPGDAVPPRAATRVSSRR